MMTQVVCSVCDEVRTITDRSVVLPYVCLGCKGTVETNTKFDAVTDFETEAAQTPEMPVTDFTAEALTTPELRDNYATVEATVTMVADLEEQLKVAKELSEGQTELITQLEEQNAILTKDRQVAIIEAEKCHAKRDLVQKELEGIKAHNQKLGEVIRLLVEDLQQSNKDRDEIVDVATALAFHLGHAHEKIAGYEYSLAQVKQLLDWGYSIHPVA